MPLHFQGDEEKRLKIPQSPFMDRESANLPKSETGFLTYLVYPLYEVRSMILFVTIRC